MLITKEQQEALVSNYMRTHSPGECIGFIEGINAIIELMSKLNK